MPLDFFLITWGTYQVSFTKFETLGGQRIASLTALAGCVFMSTNRHRPAPVSARGRGTRAVILLLQL